MNKHFSIRTMTSDEVQDIAVAWASTEGWNPGLHDAPCFYATDPNGFFIGLSGEEPVACISAVSYEGRFGFIGFYIVKPEYRGRGYGIKIWHHAMQYLQSQNTGLDGVPGQQENYKKSGFQLAYRNIRYEGITQLSPFSGQHIIPLESVPLQRIVDYDSILFPVPRPGFLSRWLNQPESHSFVALRHQEIAGYGMIRKCIRGYKIGPLFADHAALAEDLFIALNNRVDPGSPIYLDIPEINPSAIQLAQGQNMNKVFETARMYSQFAPKFDTNKIFGVTSFELG